MKPKDRKMKKIVISITGVTLALLLLIGSNLGLFAQATEANSIVSSEAINATGDGEDTTAIDQADTVVKEQEPPAVTSEKSASNSEVVSDTSQSAEQKPGVIDSQAPESAVSSEVGTVDEIEEPATFAGGDPTNPSDPAYPIKVGISTASITEITDSVALNEIGYALTISNVSVTDALNSGAQIKLEVENGIIIATSKESALDSNRESTNLVLNSISELKSFTTTINTPIAAGSGIGMSVRVYSTSPADLVLKVTVEGTTSATPSKTVTSVSEHTLQYKASYGDITEVGNYKNLFNYNDTYYDEVLPLGGKTSAVNDQKLYNTLFSNSGSVGYYNGYIKDIQVVRTLSDTRAFDLEKYNKYATLTIGGLEISIPYVVDTATKEMIWDFGDLGPGILGKNFKIQTNYVHEVPQPQFTTSDVGSKYTYYDGVRSKKISDNTDVVISAQNGGKTGSVTIAGISTGTPTNFLYSFPKAKVDKVPVDTIILESSRQASLDLFYNFVPGDLSPTDLPLKNILTEVIVPKEIELKSITGVDKLKVNKIDAYYQDTNTWVTVEENTTGFINKSIVTFDATNNTPTKLRFTVNEWTAADVCKVGETAVIDFKLKDTVKDYAKFQFEIQRVKYETALNANSSKSFFETQVFVYIPDGVVTLQHDFTGSTGDISRTYLNGESLVINESMTVNSGNLTNPYYYLKVPKGMDLSGLTGGLATPAPTVVNYDARYDILYWTFDDMSVSSTVIKQQLNSVLKFTMSVATGDYVVEVGFGSRDGDTLVNQYIPATPLATLPDEAKEVNAQLQSILGITPNSIDPEAKIYCYGYTFPITVARSNNYTTETKASGNMSSGLSSAASASAGSIADFEFTFKNVGNLSYTGTEIVTILPFVGDTLTTQGVARNSSFNVQFTDVKVLRNGVVDPNIVIQYSQSNDPVRYDSANNVQGTGSWSVTPPADKTKIKAIKIVPPSAVAPGEVITLQYTVALPHDAPVGSKIYATMGVHAVDADNTPVNIESPLASVQSENPVTKGQIFGTSYLSYGGSVYSEYNGVRYDLYKNDGSGTYVSVPGQTSYSLTSVGGVDGLFGFSNLDDGDYKIKMTIGNIAGAEFATKGVYSIDEIDSTTGWLEKSGNNVFTISGGNSISGLETAIKVKTTLQGKVNFVKNKNTLGDPVYYNGLSGFTVEAFKSGTSISLGSATTNNVGDFSIELVNFTAAADVDLKLSVPTSSNLIVQPGKTNSIVANNVQVSTGTTDVLEFFVTDIDDPTITITFENGIKTNPTEVEAAIDDDTTPVTGSWKIIEDSTGNTVYECAPTDPITANRTVKDELTYLRKDKKYGKYRFEVTATDLAGNTITKSEDFFIGEIPIITVTADDITYRYKQTPPTETVFKNDVGYAVSITAPATIDTTKTKSDYSTAVDFNTVGDYIVTFTVVDSYGLEAAKQVTVHIVYADYNIVFNSVGGTGTMANQVVHFDVATPIKTNSFTRDGYQFIGWDEAPGGTGAVDYSKTSSITKGYNAALTQVDLYARWDANKYDIAFMANNGKTPEPTSTQTGIIYDDLSVNLDLNTFTKDGYHFVGWATNRDGTGLQYSDGDPAYNVTTGSSAVLYAQWAANTYTVKFDGNGSDGGTAVPDQSFTYDDFSQKLNKNTYTKTGYSFAGWKHPVTNVVYTDEQAVTANLATGGTVTLKAQWKANNYTVKFDDNGSDGGTAVADQSFTYDDFSQKLNKNTYTKTGYTFAGWKHPVTNVVFTDEQLITSNLAISGIVVLEAQWTANTYSVIFDKNDGSTTPETTTQAGFIYDNATSQPLAPNTFTRDGYQFIGWNTKKKGGGQAFTDGAGVRNLTSDKNGTVTLYAQWKAGSASIVFDVNAIVGSTSVTNTQSSIVGVTGDSIDLSTVKIPTRDGYTFAGWNEKQDGTGSPMPTGTISMPPGTTTYYAQWAAHTYTVKFNGNGTTSVAMPNQNFTFDKSTESLNGNTYVLTGHTFKGWSLTAGGNVEYSDGQTTPNITGTNGATVELFAVWEANAYQVKFDGNGSDSGSMANQLFTYDGAGTNKVALTANAYAKTGYKFAGWNTIQSGGTASTAFDDKEKVVNLTAAPNGMVTMYAQWTPITYQVQFVGNGSTSGSMPNQTLLYDGGKLDKNIYEKTGYTFLGWSTTPTGAAQYIDEQTAPNAAVIDGKTVKLYAVWAVGLQNIQFDGNPPTGLLTVSNAQAPITQLTGSTVDLEHGVTLVPVCSGYTFIGWYDTANKTGGNLMPKTIVMPAEGKTYYARWEGNAHTISFDSTGGITTQTTINAKTDDSINLSSVKTASCDGYVFDGWFTAASGGAGIPSSITMPDADITYFAQWTANTYTIEFDGNGNTNSTTIMADQIFTYDVAQNLAQNLYTKDGYTFDGWEYNGTTYANQQSVQNLALSGTITLKAQWKANEYVVTFDGNNSTSGTMATQLFTYDAPFQALLENNYARDGYKFKGWSEAVNGAVKYADKEKVKNLTTSTAVTLYAVWEAEGTAITFDGNATTGVTFVPGAILGKTDDTINLSAVADAERTGYTFDDWYDKKTGGSLMPGSITMPAKGQTYYAYWVANDYTVKFNGNTSDSGSMSPQPFTYDVENKLTANGFSKTGYTFKNWNTKADGSGTVFYADQEKVSNLAENDGDVVELYAQWEAITYTIKFNKNGGSGTMSSQTIVYDVPTILSKSLFTRTDYNFKNWNTNAGGTGATFSDEESIINLANTQGGTIELFAQWKDIYEIEASDFIVEKSDVAGLTPADMVNRAGAKGYTKATGTIVPANLDSHGIVAVYGTYPVTFESNGEKITVKATVKDAEHLVVGAGEAIHANDIALKSTEVNAMTPTQYINKSGAKAWKTDFSNDSVEITTVDSSNIEAKAGTYEIFYSTANKTKVKAYVTVTDADSSNVDNIEKEAIQANDFTIKLADAASLVPADYVAKSSAKAWKTNAISGNALGVVADDSLVNTSQVGTYKVTYKTNTTAQTSTVALVTIYDGDHVNTDKNTVEAIQASDFAVDAKDVGSLVEADYITRSKAGAWIFDGNNILGSSTVTKANFSQVKAEKGIYPVTYSTNKGTSVVAYVAVGKGDAVATDDAKKEVIQANNFIVKGTEVANGISATDYIKKGSASAWTWDSNGQMLDITNISVNDSLVQSAAGTYPVVYTTPNGTSVQVWATVQTGDEITVDPVNSEAIQANNIILKKYQVEAGLSNQDYIDEALASAWSWLPDGTNNSETVTVVDASKVQAKEGNYPLTFKTAKGTAVTVNVEVIANNLLVVTFDGNGATVEASPKTIFVEEPATTIGSLPAQIPTRTGHTFKNWNTFANGTGSVFTIGSTVPGNMAVYAQWSVNKYNLSFDSQGGDTTPSAQVIQYNTLATKPATNPSLKGHSFIGWFTEPKGGVQWDFATTTMPANNVVLYAQYEANKYLVTFKYDESGKDTYVKVPYDTAIPQPSQPYLFGYTFVGWNDENGNEWNFATLMPDRDVTLTAQWIRTEHKLTFLTYDLKVIESRVLYAGDQVALVGAPSVGGHHFAGWVVDGTVSKWSAYMTMQDNDLTLVATYDKNPEILPESKPTSSNSANKPSSTKPSSGDKIITESANASSSVAEETSSKEISGFEESSSSAATSSVVVSSSSASLSSALSSVVEDSTESWSLLSLVLVAVGTIISIVLAFMVFKHHKTTGNRILGVIGTIIGIVALIIFILISDFSSVRVFFNPQTLIFIISLILQLVMWILAFGKKNRNDNENESEENIENDIVN